MGELAVYSSVSESLLCFIAIDPSSFSWPISLLRSEKNKCSLCLCNFVFYPLCLSDLSLCTLFIQILLPCEYLSVSPISMSYEW